MSWPDDWLPIAARVEAVRDIPVTGAQTGDDHRTLPKIVPAGARGSLIRYRPMWTQAATVQFDGIEWPIECEPDYLAAAPSVDSLRLGQQVWNLLSTIIPALVEPYRGGPLDPFHADARLPAFLADLQAAPLVDMSVLQAEVARLTAELAERTRERDYWSDEARRLQDAAAERADDRLCGITERERALERAIVALALRMGER